MGVEHPLKADVGCRNTLFNAVPQTAAEYLPRLLAHGARNLRIEFLDDSPAAVARTIGLYRETLAGRREAKNLWRELKASGQYGVTREALTVLWGEESGGLVSASIPRSIRDRIMGCDTTGKGSETRSYPEPRTGNRFYDGCPNQDRFSPGGAAVISPGRKPWGLRTKEPNSSAPEGRQTSRTSTLGGK